MCLLDSDSTVKEQDWKHSESPLEQMSAPEIVEMRICEQQDVDNDTESTALWKVASLQHLHHYTVFFKASSAAVLILLHLQSATFSKVNFVFPQLDMLILHGI